MVNNTDPPPADSSAQNGAAETSSPPSGASPDHNASTHEASNGSSIGPKSDSILNASAKKTYLSLLPQEQIIEICLLFETHVPQDVRTTIWPADLESTILELKKKASLLNQSNQHPPSTQPNGQVISSLSARNGQSTSQTLSSSTPPTHQVHPPGYYPLPPLVAELETDPPMGSLRDPAEEAREKEEREKTKASNPDSAATSHAPSPAPGDPSPSTPQQATQGPAPGSQGGTSQPAGPPQHATLHPPAPYPYAHYGYAVPPQPGKQPAYPHAPYYPPPPAYSAHYPYAHYPQPPPGYPPPPPGHPSPQSHPPGQQPLFNSQPLVRPPVRPPAAPPPQPPPPSGEDLPSYEEMIVEALLDCADDEGLAPKDLFTWMASRYPLQTNFRPSASQALQKAYKRGRLEKRDGGKYRLNANWEGGATSRRTTRRPQTLAQTTYAMHHPQQPSSPFTHAPLQPNRRNSQTPAPQPSHYGAYPYPYPYGHYPGYPQQHPTQEKPAGQAASPPAPAAEGRPPAKQGEEKEGDAWAAAQHILMAINFGNLPNGSPSAGNSSGAGPEPMAVDAEDDFGAVLTALADAAAASGGAESARTTLTDEERASLQAQLALLAAQLKEISEAEEDEDEASISSGPAPIVTTQAAASPAQPASGAAHTQSGLSPQQGPSHSPPPPESATAHAPAKIVERPPPPIAAYAGAHVVLDINAFPETFESGVHGRSSAPTTGNASGVQTEVDELGEESSDDDDDMEDVVVPLHGHDALRT